MSAQHELTRVLFPVFIHCCLKLVANGAGGEATQLIARHSQRFTLVGGQPSKVRMQVASTVPTFLKGRLLPLFLLTLITSVSFACDASQELNELQTLSMPEHLATNRMAQAALAMRYPVKLCAYSYEMLTSFLQGAKLFLILGILNEYVNFQVKARDCAPQRVSSDTAPIASIGTSVAREWEGVAECCESACLQVLEGQSPGLGEADDEEEVSLLTGQMQSEAATGQLSELNLGLLRVRPHHKQQTFA